MRRRELALADLYRRRGAYTYSAGWNWRAVAATLAGCLFAWIGLVVPALRVLYDYAWFVGFGAAFAVHYALTRLSPPPLSEATAEETASPAAVVAGE